jgi:hypothetical protein
MNTVPPWTSPYYLDGGCSNSLEVADPIEGSPTTPAPVGAVSPPGSSSVYLLPDAVFLSWFTRESPSSAIGGLYDVFGVFSGPSQPCT